MHSAGASSGDWCPRHLASSETGKDNPVFEHFDVKRPRLSGPGDGMLELTELRRDRDRPSVGMDPLIWSNGTIGQIAGSDREVCSYVSMRTGMIMRFCAQVPSIWSSPSYGGDREIIGFMIQNEESDDTWSIFFDYLKERGLQGTELIISDAHKGLVSAIRRSFTNASWQRCQVHFLRNIFSSIPKKNSKPFREAVKAIFKFTDIELARTAKNALVGEYIDQSKYTKACETLDNGFEDAFQYTVIGNGHNRLKSTNLLERLNQEVRRREKIIRIFPNRASANRLIGAVLMDLHDEWLSSTRKYIKFNQ